MIVLIREVLLVVSEESVELEALLEILSGFEAANVLQHIEIAVGVDTSLDESVPVDTLQANICVILLEREVHCRMEKDVGSLDGVHVLTRHLELVEVEVFGEHFHCLSPFLINLIIYLLY